MFSQSVVAAQVVVLMNILHGVVTNDGIELQFDVVGDGEPLLLLGGGPGADPAYLYPIVQAVSSYRKCIVLHQRGTGRSALEVQDSATVNVSTFVSDVECLRNHLEIDEWSILGHSWGGVLAMSYAARYPERVKSLVLIGIPGTDLYYSSYVDDNLLSFLTADERDHIEYWRHPERVNSQEAKYELSIGFAPACVYDRSLEKDVADIFMTINSVVEGLILQSLRSDQYDLNDSMAIFAQPVTIIHGRQDYLGEGVAYRAQNVFPNCTLMWIEKANHFPWLDHPQSFFDSLTRSLCPI